MLMKLLHLPIAQLLRTDFHSVEFSDWTGISLFVCENVGMILNRMLRVTNILLPKIQSARKKFY